MVGLRVEHAHGFEWRGLVERPVTRPQQRLPEVRAELQFDVAALVFDGRPELPEISDGVGRDMEAHLVAIPDRETAIEPAANPEAWRAQSAVEDFWRRFSAKHRGAHGELRQVDAMPAAAQRGPRTA